MENLAVLAKCGREKINITISDTANMSQKKVCLQHNTVL